MLKRFIKFVVLPFLVMAGFFSLTAQAAEPIDSTDLAIWHFNENSGATIYDATANHNDLGWSYNLWGGGQKIPDRDVGRWDLAINFKQTEEALGKSFSPAINWTTGLTIGIWIKSSLDSPYNSRFFWLGNTLDYNGVPASHLMLSLKDGEVKFNLKNNNIWQEELSSSNNVNDNQWHLINLTITAGEFKQFKLFVDGGLADQTISTSTIPEMEAVVLGRREDYSDSHQTNFRGAIDDVWIKSVSLTEQEIAVIYNQNLPYKEDIIPVPLSPVAITAYYLFDEAQGNTAADQSGHNYHLGWGYNPWGGGEDTPRWVGGKFNNAVNFRKSEEWFSINLPQVINFDQGLTISAWLKTTASSENGARFFVMADGAGNNLVLAENLGKISLNLKYTDGYDSTVNGPYYFYRNYSLISNKTINDGSWHLVTVMLDPRPYNHQILIFLDGELDSTGFFPCLPPAAIGMAVGVRENEAYYSGSQLNFSGDIDDLAILSSNLSADDVKKLYQSNQPFVWPIEKTLDPVIIVPGIMGSWNVSGKWELDPILHTYDNLWEALKLAGYEEGKTLFAFPYQWRLSNSYTAILLKQKIQEIKDICQCDKVDIIAHSMGGLVARAYVESNDYADDIDQLFFLAVPHKGATKAYLTWEAGDLGPDPLDTLKQRILSLEAYGNNYKNLYQYIKELPMQSVQELLPIYDYLRDKDTIEFRTYPNNYPMNSFLELLNNQEQLNKLNMVNIINIIGDAGTNSTINSIRVVQKDFLDGEWEYGYPEYYNIPLTDHGLEYGKGDDTVPEQSNKDFIGKENIIISSNHNGIVTDAQKVVIKELTGIEPNQEVKLNIFQKFFMVRIFSPADFVIIAPDDKKLGKDFIKNQAINEINGAFYSGFDSDTEFAVIPDPIDGEYRVELQGTGQGGYKLSTSFIDDNKEIDKEFSGNIKTGQDRDFTIDYTSQAVEPISELQPADTMPPVITINNPLEGNKYSHSENLIIDYDVTDDFSGVAATSTKIDNQILTSNTIDLFDYSLGSHILTTTALDKVGNQALRQVSFVITANIDSTIADIEKIYQRGWLTSQFYKILLVDAFKLLAVVVKSFDAQIQTLQDQIIKTQNDPKIKPEIKQKLIGQYNKQINTLKINRQKAINLSLDLIVKSLDLTKKLKLINQLGYDIIINDINYLRINL